MLKLTKAVLDAKIAWLDDCMKGEFIPSHDNDERDKNWQKICIQRKRRK